MATQNHYIRPIFVLILVLITIVFPDASYANLPAGPQQRVIAWTGRNKGGLTAAPQTLHFGRVGVGQSMSLSTTLTNRQTTSITISDLTQEGAGFAVEGLNLPVTLDAGQSMPLDVTFSPREGGRMIGNITLMSDAYNSKLVIYVRGAGTSSGNLGAAPTSLDFGTVPVGGTQTLSATLTNSGGQIVTITQVMTATADFSLSGVTLPFTLLPSQSFTFSAVFSPQSGGNASDDISIVSNAADSTLNIPIAGIGMAAGQLALSPPDLSFGDVLAGTTKSLSTMITASVSSVTITSGTISGSDFTMSGVSFPVTIGAGQSLGVTMTFAPQGYGTASGSATFVSNAGNSPAMESLTGNGSAPTAHTVDLTWSANGSGIAGFYVYRGGRAGGPYFKINTGPEPNANYTDTTVSSGQTYYYVATAVDGNGIESSYSNEIREVIPNP